MGAVPSHWKFQITPKKPCSYQRSMQPPKTHSHQRPIPTKDPRSHQRSMFCQKSPQMKHYLSLCQPKTTKNDLIRGIEKVNGAFFSMSKLVVGEKRHLAWEDGVGYGARLLFFIQQSPLPLHSKSGIVIFR